MSVERLEAFTEPILVMETRRLRRRGFRFVTAIAVLMLSLLPLLVLLWRWDGTVARVVLMVASGGYLFLSIVMIPAYGSRSISREKETGTWDMLAMTLLKSSQIADQKIVAAALPMLLMWAASLPIAAALALYGGASALEFVALEATLVLNALAISAWSVEASSECGSSAQAVAYLPASIYLCGIPAIIVYLVVGVVLLLMPATRAQSGRLLVGGICILLACGAAQYYVGMMFVETMLRHLPGGMFGLGLGWPIWAVALVAFAVSAAAAVGLRYVLAWSIEGRRRA